MNIILSFTSKVSIVSNKKKCTRKCTNGLIAGQGRHTHIKTTNVSTCTNLTHLNITLSFTSKVSIVSNKKKCTRKCTNGHIAGQGRHTHIKTTNSNTCTNLTHLNITLSFTSKVSIVSNKKKCTRKCTNGHIAGQGRHTHIKTTNSNTCTNLTHLNIILSFTSNDLALK